jgi:CO/xanthine dehydrogenase FAD-binding subunit
VSLRVATTLDEALMALRTDPGLWPMAGGVGVMLAAALGAPPAADRWLSIGGLAELRGVGSGRDGSTVVGAATTLADLADAAHIAPGLLSAAARSTANAGIRAVATIGGNVIAGGAASDPVAALVALDAAAELVSIGRTRRVAVLELIRDGVAPGELVRAFHIPADGPTSDGSPIGWGWQRLPYRGAMDSSIASVAVVAGRRPRVAVTFAAGTVLRLRSVEGLLAEGGSGGRRSGTVRDAASGDLGSVRLHRDHRASEAYRRRVVPVLVARAVAQALGTANRRNLRA